MNAFEIAREGCQVPLGTPLTVEMLADALDCFWNAALGATHAYSDTTANAVMSGMVQGMAAVAVRLRELAPNTPVPGD